MNIYTVYCLCDQNENPFYVGCTKNYASRMAHHIRNALARLEDPDSVFEDVPKDGRIREIYQHGGYVVSHKILETSDATVASVVERLFIENYQGELMNVGFRPKHLRPKRVGGRWRVEGFTPRMIFIPQQNKDARRFQQAS